MKTALFHIVVGASFMLNWHFYAAQKDARALVPASCPREIVAQTLPQNAAFQALVKHINGGK